MESSVARSSEGDEEEDGVYLFIVDNETEGQPKNIDDKNSQPSMNDNEIKHEKTPDLDLMIKTEDIKTENEFEPMVEEYISDETFVLSEDDNKKVINKKQPKNSGNRRMLLPKHKQVSFVNQLRRSNPDCKDEAVLISQLCKIMREIKPPPAPDDHMIENNSSYECTKCGYIAPRMLMVTHHWQEKHGTRYLNCLACGADFRWPANLYKHERACNAPDIKLVLKARNLVKQHKNKRDTTKQGQPSGQDLLVERNVKNKRGQKRKAVKENKAKTKASQEKKPKLRDIVENHEEVSDSDMSLEVPEIDSGTDSDYILSGREDSDSDFDLPLVKPNPKPRRQRGIPRRSPIRETQQPAYLNELRKEKPALYNDKEELVKALAEIMSKEKPPDPPEGFALLNEDRIYECTKCEFKHKSRSTTARHWQYIHGPRYYKCYACGVCFRSPGNLYRHEKRCTSADTYIVLRARARSIVWNGRNNRPFLEETVTKIKTERKRKRNKKTGDYICSFCSREFKNTRTLDAHENLHKAERPYQCEHCPMNYYDKATLYRHIQRKHRPGHFLCEHCSHVFTTRDHLRSHMNSHLPEKRHRCPHCDKRYVHTTDLKIHVDKHHLKVPAHCACKLCPKRYRKMTLLKQHMLKEHGVTIVSRAMLNRKNFNISKEQLKNAIVVKKSEFTVKADENNSNSTEKELQNDGELIKNELDVNRVIIYCDDQEEKLNDGKGAEANPDGSQAPPKKLECPDCDKQYMCKNDLRHHVNRVHLNLPQPFPCSMCDKRCCNMKTLRGHMLTKHGMEIIPRTKVHKKLSKLSEEQLKNITVVKKPDKPDSDQISIEKVSIEIGFPEGFNLNKNTESQETLDTSSQDVIVEGEVEMDSTQNYEDFEVEGETEIIDDTIHNYEGLEGEGETEIIDDTIHNYEGSEDEGVTEINDDTIHNYEGLEDEGVTEIIDDTIHNYEGLEDEGGTEIIDDTIHNYEGLEDEGGTENIEEEVGEEEYIEDYLEEEEEDEQEPPEDLLEIFNKTEKKKPMLVIKDGQAVFMDGDNVGYFKKSSRNFKIKSENFHTKSDVMYKEHNSEAKVAVEYQEDVITETNQALLQYYDKFCNRAVDDKPFKKESPKKGVKIIPTYEANKTPKLQITPIDIAMKTPILQITSTKEAMKTPKLQVTPIEIAKKTPKQQISPIQEAMKTPKLQITPIKIAKKTLKQQISPIKEAMKTPKLQITPIEIAKKTLKQQISPIKEAMKTPKLQITPIEIAKETPKLQITPIKIAKKTLKQQISPIKEAMKTPKLQITPIEIAKKTLKQQISPIKEAMKTPKLQITPIEIAKETPKLQITPIQEVKKTPKLRITSIQEVKKTPTLQTTSMKEAKKTPTLQTTSMKEAKKTPTLRTTSIQEVKKTPTLQTTSMKEAKKTPTLQTTSMKEAKKTPTLQTTSIQEVKKTPTLQTTSIKEAKKTPKLQTTSMKEAKKTSTLQTTSIQEVKKTPTLQTTSIQVVKKVDEEMKIEEVRKRRHVRKKRYPSSEWAG